MKVKPGQIVLVKWMDAGHLLPGQWVQPHEIPEPQMHCRTVGIVVRKSKHHLVVAATRANFNEDGDWTGLFCIPRKMIRKLRRLK